MSEKITPTTVEVRAAYRRSESSLAGSPHGPWVSPVELHAEFDRWLAAHDAEIRAESTPAPVSGDDRDDMRAIINEALREDREGFGSCDFPATLTDRILAAGFSHSPAVQVDAANTGWPDNDDTFTPDPRLWLVQSADESRDCDGSYPLTPHYVMARCADDAANRAGEDFDMSEGIEVTGHYQLRPATGSEIEAFAAALRSPVGDGQ